MTQTSGALRREIAKLYLAVIARSDSDEAIQLSFSRRQTWIASAFAQELRRTSRFARNDGL
jgi:hypothetical protein